jgi:hypothetical protein
MEYYLGFAFAVFLAIVLIKLQEKYNIFYEFSSKNIMLRQSHYHGIKVSQLKNKNISSKKRRQSSLHVEKTNIKVIIMDDQAYWVKDNVFYTADMSGEIVDKETTRVVDTMTMNRIQLDKMMFIIDKLREGTFDDRGGTRN